MLQWKQTIMDCVNLENIDEEENEQHLNFSSLDLLKAKFELTQRHDCNDWEETLNLLE